MNIEFNRGEKRRQKGNGRHDGCARLCEAFLRTNGANQT
jgi:hypothetical protein